MTTALATYNFRITLEGKNVLDDKLTDALYEAGCDDSTVSSFGKMVSVHFGRESTRLALAVGSAIADIEAAGYKVKLIEIMAE